MKETRRYQIIEIIKMIKPWIIIVSLIPLGLAAWFYSRLPAEIPLHFNLKGEIDNWGSKNFIWLTGSLPTAVYLLMVFIPLIDPRQESYRQHKRAYSIISFAVVLFFVALNIFILLFSLGFSLNIRLFILLAIGLLFIVIGNYLPTARRNYSFGIKTPWTLANESSWNKTHRIGGYGFVIAGIILLISAFLPDFPAFVTVISTVLVLVIGLFVYSYLIFRTDKKKSTGKDNEGK